MTGERYDGCTHATPHFHGQNRTYAAHRCRCLLCRAAHADLVRTARVDQIKGRPREVDAAPARAHLRRLLATGMSYSAVAERSGQSSRNLTTLMHGYPSRGTPPPPVIRRSTAEGILAVPVPRFVHEAAPAQRTSSLGSRRRLQALHAVGWNVQAMAAAGTVSAATLYKVMGGEGRIALSSAQGIAELYERLWDQTPTADTPRARAAIAQTRRRARAAGWAPPAAWDDRDLDRADGRPQGVETDGGASHGPGPARRVI